MTSLMQKNASYNTSINKGAAGADGRAKEYLWGVTLSKENKEYTWTVKEEDGDTDFMEHTLFLRHAVLGVGCVEDERNMVGIETMGYNKTEIALPLFSLTSGKSEMCQLDVNVGSDQQPVTFKLLEGSGPVHILSQHLVEYPADEVFDDTAYTAAEEESDEDVALEEEEEEQNVGQGDGKVKKASVKRKAVAVKTSKKKKGKKSESEDEEKEDESMEDAEEDDEEEVESSPEKKKDQKGKSKITAKKTKAVSGKKSKK